MSLTATVTSPCPGAQTLEQLNASFYQGASGTYDFVVLAADPTRGWLMTVYDYSSQSSPCYPSVQFGQVTPDTTDPTGVYGKMVNGSPNTGAGTAVVS